jgi:hypothetical protein
LDQELPAAVVEFLVELPFGAKEAEFDEPMPVDLEAIELFAHEAEF